MINPKKQKQKIITTLICSSLLLSMGLTSTNSLAYAEDTNSATSEQSTDQTTDSSQQENQLTSVFVYGNSQNQDEYKQVVEALGINDSYQDGVNKFSMDKSLMEHYVGPMPNVIGVWSSVKVTKEAKNTGVNVQIKTPENIEVVTENQYRNAAITAGATDVTIDVASGTKARGEGALAGVPLALEKLGMKVNNERFKAGQDELQATTAIKESNPDINDKKFNDALADIKLQLGQLKDSTLTEDQVRKIVEDTLAKYNVNIKDKESLNNLINVINIANGNNFYSDKTTQKELNNFLGNLKDKGTKAYNEAKESGFFQRIWEWIKSLFN